MVTTTRRGRVLSEAQQQASAERRERFRALAKHVAALTEDARAALAQRMAVRTIEGHALSVHNACLAYFQRADCTIVGGFNQWRAAGRMVRKGEHGIMLWAPSARKTEDSEETSLGFVPITMFDVAQTEEIEAAAA